MYKGSGVEPAVVSEPKQYDGDIYYIEVTFPDGRAVLPVSEGVQQCEILLAIVCPDYGKGWDESNDYSAKGLPGEGNIKTEYIPVYENGQLIFGTEPDGTKGTGSISANPASGSKPNGTTPIQTETTPQSTTTTTVSSDSKTTTTVSETTASNVPTATCWGDVNLDDEVDVSDAVLLARFAAEDATAKITAQGKINADVTGDRNLNGDDTMKILRAIAKLIPMGQLNPYAR